MTAAGPQFGPPGYETDLLCLACLAALVVGGSGPFAVDGLIANRVPRKKTVQFRGSPPVSGTHMGAEYGESISFMSDFWCPSSPGASAHGITHAGHKSLIFSAGRVSWTGWSFE